MYKTGTRPVVADGNIEFLGRTRTGKDTGISIEWGEIEAALAKHQGCGKRW